MKARGYIRVSTEEQAREGISLEHQREKIKAYAALHDIELVEIIEDRGVSAKDIKGRPGFTRLLGELGHDAVIVYKLDRMFRNAAEALQVAEQFNQNCVALHSVTEKLDTQSAMGKFFFTIAAAFAEMERNLISERTRDALRHKKAKGQVYNHVPYGFKKQGGRLAEDLYEQGQLLWMKAKRAEGWPYLRIAEQLNENQIPTKAGGCWHAQTVKNILDRTPIGEGR